MTLTERFQSLIEEHHLFEKGDMLLLTVSGGRDSVVLCELCHQCGFNFEIAHCNFQLRGEESDRDEAFVTHLANHYSVPFHVKKFDTARFAEENKISVQVAARQLRYDWFHEIAGQLSSGNRKAWIVTAHHANDNIETLLMNFFKGTGIDGLQGIPVKNKNIIRPLLFATREEINLFVSENNLEFVEDSSNLSDKYTRNFFRNQLIPEVKKVFPAVEENLLSNINKFHEMKIIYDEAIEQKCKKLFVRNGNEFALPVLKLLKTKALPSILYEIIKEFNFHATQLGEVMKLLHSESGRFISSSTHRIIRNREWLIIAPLKNEEANHILIQKGEKRVDFRDGKIKIEELEWHHGDSFSENSEVALLDSKEIEFPLLLRPWKQGDYLYPLGMQKKKKLSRFFIDRKLSVLQKEKIWVIESDKRILWIVGFRIDNRFRVTEATKRVVRISIE